MSDEEKAKEDIRFHTEFLRILVTILIPLGAGIVAFGLKQKRTYYEENVLLVGYALGVCLILVILGIITYIYYLIKHL